VFQVNEEFAKDLSENTAVSKVKKKKCVNNQKNEDRALTSYVASLKEYLNEAGGHGELILEESYSFTVKGGLPTCVFVFVPETPRTCFCTKHVHDSNGFRITWGHKKAIYHCYSGKCKAHPKEMENLEITLMKRMQHTERAKNTHLILEAPPGWEYEKRTDPWVQPLESDLKEYGLVAIKANMGTGKSMKMQEAMMNLSPKIILFMGFRRLFEDCVFEDLQAKQIDIAHYKMSVVELDADKLVLQMGSLARVAEDKVYKMIIIDESESCFECFSLVTMDYKLAKCATTFERILKTAKYVIATDAFLSTRTILGFHHMGLGGKIVEYTHQLFERTANHVKKP
jgi:hypothetical protein